MTSGATVTALRVAEVELAGKYNPPSFEDTRIPVNAFLIEDDGALMLVDTGVGVGNDYVDQRFQPERRDLTAALGDRNVTPRDIDIVINSHLHFDHCGNNALFPHAQFLIQRAEIETARTTLYTVREWFDFDDAKLVPIDGDHAVARNVQILATPGHTPGHQSVLVGGENPVLIAAQAAFDAGEFAHGPRADVQAHEGLEDAYTGSFQRLHELNAHTVFLSHENYEIEEAP